MHASFRPRIEITGLLSNQPTIRTKSPSAYLELIYILFLLLKSVFE